MPLNAWSTRDRQRVSGEGVSAMSGVTPGTAGTAGRIAIIGTAAIGIRGAMVIGGMSMTSGTSGASGISGISGISISMSMSESAPRGVIAGPIKSKSIAIGASIGMSTMSDISGISGMSGMSGMSGISMSMSAGGAAGAGGAGVGFCAASGRAQNKAAAIRVTLVILVLTRRIELWRLRN